MNWQCPNCHRWVWRTSWQRIGAQKDPRMCGRCTRLARERRARREEE
jgi:hypothetical protein